MQTPHPRFCCKAVSVDSTRSYGPRQLSPCSTVLHLFGYVRDECRVSPVSTLSLSFRFLFCINTMPTKLQSSNACHPKGLQRYMGAFTPHSITSLLACQSDDESRESTSSWDKAPTVEKQGSVFQGANIRARIAGSLVCLVTLPTISKARMKTTRLAKRRTRKGLTRDPTTEQREGRQRNAGVLRYSAAGWIYNTCLHPLLQSNVARTR